MAKNLNWFQASVLMFAGKGVRRDAWRKWIVWQHNLGWLLQPALEGVDPFTRIARNSDFAVDEFKALDWTDETWADGPVAPLVAVDATVDADTSGASGGTGGSAGSAGSSALATNIWDAIGTNSGGSSGHSSVTGATIDASTPAAGQIPVITVTCVSLDDPDGGGGTCWNTAPATFRMAVTITITGGPAGGVGGLSIKFQGRTVLVGNGYAGYNATTTVADATLTPGAAFQVTAYYAADSRDGYSPGTLWSGTGTMTCAPLCSAVPGIPWTIQTDTAHTGTLTNGASATAAGTMTYSSADYAAYMQFSTTGFSGPQLAAATLTLNGVTMPHTAVGTLTGWSIYYATAWSYVVEGTNTIVITTTGFGATLQFNFHFTP